MTTNSTIFRSGHDASVRGRVSQQSVSYKVLREVISCDPSLSWSPTWPEQQVERTENKGLWRGPGVKRRSLGPHFALIPGSKQGEQTTWLPHLSREREPCLAHMLTHLSGQLTFPPPSIYTSGLTHPATLLAAPPTPPSPAPEPLATVPTTRALSPFGSTSD